MTKETFVPVITANDFVSYDPRIDEIVEQIYLGLTNKLNDLIVEGLKIKGFEFKNKTDLENFVKSNCNCVDKTDIKQRIYSVNGIPFFIHFYGIDPTINFNTKSIKYGSYTYL